ncbi:hypothetical protein ACFVT5_12725 [Streptomyces sp. NPDC058001]|uniref:hypothetical protein n=1 Tax=Streptomyces sp. NPDC058001 TaxID=3346300 RepID=UPI0036E4106D
MVWDQRPENGKESGDGGTGAGATGGAQTPTPNTPPSEQPSDRIPEQRSTQTPDQPSVPSQAQPPTPVPPPPPAQAPAEAPAQPSVPPQSPAPPSYQPYGPPPGPSPAGPTPSAPSAPENPYGPPPGGPLPPDFSPGEFLLGGPPPRPPAPSGPADPLRAVAVALLNLSGLGIGYALLRRWGATGVCWVATAALLFVALPADVDGVSGGALVAYLVLLALAALHGAFRALRTPLSWPPRAPIALVLGLVLLAVPAGGVVAYGAAHDEAVEQMLLDRLDNADRLVRAAAGRPFTTGEADFRKALTLYGDLGDDHPDSRAAHRVPDRLTAYYKTVGAPYADKKYCEAVAPLTYLRTVPKVIDRERLGSLAGWPDDRLATSLYECGVTELGVTESVDAPDGNLGELLRTFPESEPAARVEPAVSSAIDAAAKGIKGDKPCDATDRLRVLNRQALRLPGDKAGVTDALHKDAGRAESKLAAGSYACGVDQYKDGDFKAAQGTLDDFIASYKNDKNRARAQKIVIAAEIAQTEPAAGKRLPSTGNPGGSIPVTFKNDSPDEIEVLFTGPVTGSMKLKRCAGCTTYSTAISAQFSACKASGRNYPSKTLSLPPGTYYFLHKPVDNPTVTTPGSDTANIRNGYLYTECAYVLTNGLGYGL